MGVAGYHTEKYEEQDQGLFHHPGDSSQHEKK